MLYLPANSKPMQGQQIDWDAWGIPRPLIEWWFNEQSGTITSNAVGFDNFGTLTNGACFVPSANGGGAYTDGVNDYVRGDIKCIPVSNKATAYWFGSATFNARYDTLCHSTGASVQGLRMWTTSNAAPFYLHATVKTSSLEYGLRPSAVVINGGYHHIALIANVNQAYLNVDGVRIHTTNIDGSFDAPNLIKIGTSGDTATDVSRPTLATTERYMYWNAALTQDQLCALQGPVPIWTPRNYHIVSTETIITPKSLATLGVG